MTKLTRSTKREVDLYGVGPVIVGMDPKKSFVFREKGCQKTYEISILTVFVMAIKASEKGGTNGRKGIAAKVPLSTKEGRGTKPSDRL